MTAACPACIAGGETLAVDPKTDRGAIQISLPGIHCAGCIAGVERLLMSTNGVVSARVNLGLKRVRVQTAAGVSAEPLIETLQTNGFEALALDEASLGPLKDTQGHDLLLRLAVAGFAMMNVMLLSVAVWSGASDSTRDLFHWASAAIALPAVIYSGRPFYQSAIAALRAGRLNMDVPISLAIILASGMSLYETALSGQHAYFDAALSLTFFLLIGRYLDHSTRRAARSAAQELAALEVESVTRKVGANLQAVPLSDVVLGDLLHVAAGQRVPSDGVIAQGSSQIDRSFISGESLPIGLAHGDQVIAGDVNLTGPIEIEVTAIGEDTTLRKMAALVEVAESARNGYTGLAERAAQIYAPAVHILAALAFAGWWFGTGDVRLSLNIAIAVLIITCPCALGLAVPAVTTVASGKMFRRGMLLKSATVLERLAAVDTVVFDKTGTLTTGRAVIDTAGISSMHLGVLKALAQNSDHPVSQSILAALPTGTQPQELSNVQEFANKGVSAVWQGQTVKLGNAKWVGGKTSPAFSVGAQQPYTIEIHERLRDGVCEAVEQFKSMGLRVMMLTGDNAQAASKVTKMAGIETVHSNLRPEDKFQIITAEKDLGHRHLMIGDGLNDTPVLAASHVALAPGTALEAARLVSDIVVLSPSFSVLPSAVRIAHQSRRRVIENFATAAVYNLVAVPIALAGFATPLMAAIAMSLSSISVLLNAMRIKG